MNNLYLHQQNPPEPRLRVTWSLGGRPFTDDLHTGKPCQNKLAPMHSNKPSRAAYVLKVTLM